MSIFRSKVLVSVLLLLSACAGLSESMKEAERQRLLEERQALALLNGQAALSECIRVLCETLNLDGMRLEDYSVINDLTHVKSLMLSGTDFSQLSDIADMGQLKELHITYTDVADLSLLSNFPELEVLHFEGGIPSVDKRPIGQLSNLKNLAVGNLAEGTGGFVRDLPNLEELLIGWNDSTANISVLDDHPSLRVVDIGGRLPEDQSALLRIKNLESIMFFDLRTLNEEVRKELEDRDVLKYEMAIIVC